MAALSSPLVLVAMEAEAAPVRSELGLHGDGQLLDPRFPARLWRNESCALAINGVDDRFGVDSIGSIPAITTTIHAATKVQPSIIVSAGTAGGFSARGGEIAKAYLANRCVFHDRRIDLPGFDEYGIGDYPVAELGAVASTLGVEEGTVSSGSALDAPSDDVVRMEASGAVAKDMEAAAIAWLCQHLGIQFTALKVITDLVDAPEEPGEQFLRNLEAATRTLATQVRRLIDALQDFRQPIQH